MSQQRSSSHLAAELLDGLIVAGQSIAVAESLTGGLLADALVRVPGASAAMRGGTVAYTNEMKTLQLDVPPEMLAAHGAVSEPVAQAMAQGVRGRFAATWGLSTTGVAGPGADDSGTSAGTVVVGVDGPGGAASRLLQLPGNRDEVRRAAVEAALELLQEQLMN